MVEDVHTERLLVTVFKFLRDLCIHHENNSDVPEYYVEVLTIDRLLYASHKMYTGLVSR